MKTLRDKAVLVRVKMTQWNIYVHDKALSNQLTAASGVAKNRARVNKHLMKDCAQFKAVRSAFTELGNYVRLHTLPWLDEGVRILPAENYLEFTQTLGQLKSRIDTELDQLVAVWDSEVQRDIRLLNGLSSPADYPPADKIRNYYTVSVRFMPIPASSDFRVEVDEADKQALEDAVKEAEESVTKHIIEELTEPLARLSKRLSEYKGGKGERWHNSLVENVRETAARMRRLNINNDPEIERIALEIQQALSPYAARPEDIREDKGFRSQAKRTADDLLTKLSGWS